MNILNINHKVVVLNMITDVHSNGSGKVKWISTDWLEDNLDNEFMIIDVQPDIHHYIKELPGAYYFNEWFLRQIVSNVPGSYIPLEAIQAIFKKQGIKRNMSTVVYTGKGAYSNSGDGWGQTMAAYSLLRFGHNDLYLLDGSIDKWKKEGKDLTKIFPTIKESKFEVMLREDYYVTYEEFKAVKDYEDVVVVDARPFKYYAGPSMWIKP